MFAVNILLDQNCTTLNFCSAVSLRLFASPVKLSSHAQSLLFAINRKMHTAYTTFFIFLSPAIQTTSANLFWKSSPEFHKSLFPCFEHDLSSELCTLNEVSNFYCLTLNTPWYHVHEFFPLLYMRNYFREKCPLRYFELFTSSLHIQKKLYPGRVLFRCRQVRYFYVYDDRFKPSAVR